MSARRATWELALGLCVLALCLGLVPLAGAAEPTLESLLGDLLRARRPETTDAALDALSARIGKSPGFADAGAFADWLGNIAPKKAEEGRVLLRRGWGYVTAGRGRDAIQPLEKVLADPGIQSIANGYLGVAWRQVGESEKALAFLGRAARGGFVETFLDENAEKAAHDLRRARPAKEARGLPAYAGPLAGYLDARAGRPALRAVLARWLLVDHASFAKPGASRGQAWARLAAEQAMRAVAADPGLAGGARLAYDAAVALRSEDEATGGRTGRFDLLALACRVGDRPEIESHDVPQAFTDLAEAALDEGRYELAYRMARRRLDLSDSPAARRVLAELPPDVGD